jgi:hypothetical protein
MFVLKFDYIATDDTYEKMFTYVIWTSDIVAALYVLDQFVHFGFAYKIESGSFNAI